MVFLLPRARGGFTVSTAFTDLGGDDPINKKGRSNGTALFVD
jgi:hypothetical protein